MKPLDDPLDPHSGLRKLIYDSGAQVEVYSPENYPAKNCR
jgi:hypothetical protein